MRCVVERDVLSEAVAWAARSLPGRPAAPVLAGLLLETDQAGRRLTVSGFDHDVSSRTEIAAEAGEPGRLLVHGRLLADIAKALPDHVVEIATEGAKAVVSCGSDRFTLQTLPVEDYPALPPLPAATGTVDAATLATAVSQTVTAAGRDDIIPMLTGVRLELHGAKLTLAATDRYRLAVRELPWQPEDPGVSATALVPAKILSDAARALAGAGRVTLALAEGGAGEGLIGFESGAGARRTTSRLLAGEFVRYRSLLPDEYAITATVETARFLQAAKRVALVADRTSPIRLTFAGGRVRLEAGAGDEAHASATLDAVLDGADVTVSFNPAFLVDGLHALDTPYAQLSFTTATRPTVLMGREALDVPARADFRYLMLPLKAPAG